MNRFFTWIENSKLGKKFDQFFNWLEGPVPEEEEYVSYFLRRGTVNTYLLGAAIYMVFELIRAI